MRRLAVVVAALSACLGGSLMGVMPVSAAARAPYPVPYNFLTSAITAGVNVNADPPGSNDWSCQPTTAHPRPVVLVHGTAGNKNTNWQTYSPLLANAGYCVFALTYGVAAGTPPGADQFGGLDDIVTSAKLLKKFVHRVLKATGAKKVDIVGHSQGTLMPNYYVKFLGGAKHVKHYVSLAPLWHGTSVGAADELTQLGAVFGQHGTSIPGCAACSQMVTGSDFMKKMRTGRVAARHVQYTNIMTQYDELVSPYTSGREKHMTNFVVQHFCATDYTEHFEIAADPVASVLVLNALDPMHPQTVPCMLVLPFEGPPTP